MADYMCSVKVVRKIKIYTVLLESFEVLKFDGSNFILWYKRLCDMLKCDNQIHLIREPLGEEPDKSKALEDFLAGNSPLDHA